MGAGHPVRQREQNELKVKRPYCLQLQELIIKREGLPWMKKRFITCFLFIYCYISHKFHYDAYNNFLLLSILGLYEFEENSILDIYDDTIDKVHIKEVKEIEPSVLFEEVKETKNESVKKKETNNFLRLIVVLQCCLKNQSNLLLLKILICFPLI